MLQWQLIASLTFLGNSMSSHGDVFIPSVAQEIDVYSTFLLSWFIFLIFKFN